MCRLPGQPRHRILLGLPFYGFEYVWARKAGQLQLTAADAVLAGRLLEVLNTTARSEARAAQRQQAKQQQCEAGGAEGAGSCAAAGGPSSGGGAGSSLLRIEWLEESGEHVFRFNHKVCGRKKSRSKLALHFPTPRSTVARLAAADARGMGAAAWELGQGLDAFCGLL